MASHYLFDVELTGTLGLSHQRSPSVSVAVDGHELGGLAERVGVRIRVAPELLVRLGPIQRWLFERLLADTGRDQGRPWVPIAQLAAEYVGGRPTRRQVDSVRHACRRLARAGLVETSQRWMEREEERRGLPWLRRETTVRRRHLCARIPT
ncbi:MAG: hypothetical protein M3198_14265 [Actinomycetota bacterium]|nr:hypothetical protein [Actinomycetota bacterium]